MKSIVTFTLLLFASICFSQSEINSIENYLGIYKGKLSIFSEKGKQEIDMEFHFVKTDTLGTYKYTLVYNNQYRNYFLIEKDVLKGKYSIDENNGIELEASVFDNAIYSIFEVQGNLITTTEHFYDTYMDFEIMMTKVLQKTTTGKGTEEIPEVQNYPVFVAQKARLYKEK